MPGSHATQCVIFSQRSPAAHETHEALLACPESLEINPIGHAVHPRAPGKENVPASHPSHDVLPV